MTTETRWWHSPEFAEFLPYITATAAGDKRNYHSPRFDLKTNTPYAIERKALAYRAPCVACGALIAPFRQRRGSRNIYMAVSCDQQRNNACSRGRQAPVVYQLIWDLIKGGPPDADQGALF